MALPPQEHKAAAAGRPATVAQVVQRNAALPRLPPQVKQYFEAITGRRNTVNGLLYHNDPTIMSWVGLEAGYACGWHAAGVMRMHG